VVTARKNLFDFHNFSAFRLRSFLYYTDFSLYLQ
jgi:hypothetical protein